jgi:hypothetical protein
MKTADLRALLRAWYEKEAYVVLEEVSDDAGFNRSRSADMIVQGLWPSRGLLLEGIEIKVSRADWIKELRSPEKAETFVRWCDKWWIATGDPAIIQAGELPDTWGHLSVVNGRLKVITPAPKLEPQPLERGFLAAMMKRARNFPTEVIDEQVAAKLALVLESKLRQRDHQAQQTRDQLAHALARIRAFERVTGLNVGCPNPEEAAVFQALKALTELKLPGAKDLLDQVGQMESTVAQALHGIRRVKEAYGPALAKFEEAALVQLPPAKPTSLLQVDTRSTFYGAQGPAASGHVLSTTLHELQREKVKCSRGFFRIWEPPLIGCARSHGTKRRPSLRFAQQEETAPAYRLELRHIAVDGHDVEIIYTEQADIGPSWDMVVLLPEGWTPKQPDARLLSLVLEVDERPHRAWAVTITPEVPLGELGAWLMSGETHEASA